MKAIEKFLEKVLFTKEIEDKQKSDRNIKKWEDLAEVLLCIAEGLRKEIPEDAPLILLGRDTWPLIPILRFGGRRCQYFLWSRLQGQATWDCEPNYCHLGKIEPPSRLDKATKEQWLREVPPGAWVVDTGYQGSIPLAIATIDKEFKWQRTRLISSWGIIPQLHLERELSHEEIVNEIEHLEKLTNRSVSFSRNGAVIWKKGRCGDSGSRKEAVQKVVKNNYYLLRACGLPHPWAEKYSKFTGTTPKERLDLSAKERQIHYREVSFLRNKYPSEQWVVHD